jgi:hypothetical protein
MKKLHLLFLGVSVLALAAALPAQAHVISFNVTTTWYEPEEDPDNSIFVGSFSYDTSTHAVTNLQGVLSESMTGTGGHPYNPATGPGVSDDMTWLSLTNQLPNGDASHTYEWHDDAKGGTFATVFLQNTSLTFRTSYNGVTGDGWSPQGGIAVKWKYPVPNDSPNASALIFVPDDLSAANTTSNPLSLTWDESTDTGSLGLAYTAYADNTPGGYMGSIGMTGTSKYAYGASGSMKGVPLSEEITVASVPEPTALGMAISGILVLLACSCRKAAPVSRR